MPMTTEEYEASVVRTCTHLQSIEHIQAIEQAILGLNSEAGELAGIWEKRWHQGHILDRDEMLKELGDALWYLTEAVLGMGFSLDMVMEANVRKLAKRYPDRFTVEDSVRRVDHDR